MVNIPEIQRETTVLTDLLEAFQPTKIPDSFFLGMQHIPSPGNISYLYSGACYYLEELFSVGMLLTYCPFYFYIFVDFLFRIYVI